jgi:hypothetical protein
LKRITVWIDSKNDSVEQVRERLKEFLAQTGLRYKIVETCELIEPEESK